MRRYLLLLFLSALVAYSAPAAPGDWPEPRQNPHLTGIQPMAGKMTSAPASLAKYDLGRSAPELRVVERGEGQGYVGLGLVAGALQCYDLTGQRLWESHPAGLNFSKIEAVDDLDGDGQAEIALMAGRAADPFGAAVLVSLDDGRVLWRYDVEPMSYVWYLHIGSYVPGAQGKQIVVLVHAYPPDKDNGYIALFDYSAPGQAPAQKWRYDFDHYTCFPSLLQNDLDGDGAQELVVETHSRMWFLDAVTGVPKHFVLWDVAPANNRSYGFIDFADFNGDGRDDFLCIGDFAQHHEVLLNRDGKMEMAWCHGWPESVTTRHVATTWPEPPYGDIDGDGRVEIVLSMYNSEDEGAWLIRVYDAVTGELKYRLPGMVAAGLEDCTGDGTPEILANVTDDPTEAVTRGARLLDVEEGRLKAVWQDDAAVAIRPENPKRHNPDRRKESHFGRAGKLFELQRGDDGALTEKEWAPPAKKEKPPVVNPPAVAGPVPLPELLAIGGPEGNNLLVYSGGRARVLRLRGTTLESVAEYASSCLPACADLDGDGVPEIVTATVSPDAQPVVEAFALGPEKRSLWRKEYPPTDRVGFPHGRTAYLRAGWFTGKLTSDIYAWTGTPLGRSALLDGKSGEIRWETGEMKSVERYAAPTINQASTFDFNGDGAEDLVFTAPDYYCIADGSTGRFLLGPLFPPDIFKQPSQGLYTFPAILERHDRDPLVALVAGHYFQGVMSMKAAPLWYKLPMCGEARCAQEAFLRLADGTWLMGVGRQNGNFACTDLANGSVRWELPLEASASDAAVCDINGDGAQEFLVGTSHGKLWAIGDGVDKPAVLWTTDLSAGIGAPIAADLDGDGACELAVATTDGYVHILAPRP